ncbi:MAG: hypothetical protein AAGA90_23705 [Actinomycetota bacterium]
MESTTTTTRTLPYLVRVDQLLPTDRIQIGLLERIVDCYQDEILYFTDGRSLPIKPATHYRVDRDADRYTTTLGYIGDQDIIWDRYDQRFRVGQATFLAAEIANVIRTAGPTHVVLNPGVRLDEAGLLTVNGDPVR